MKTKIFTVAILASLFSFTFAQAQTFAVGDNVLGIGIGLGSSIGSFGYSGQTPSFNAHYERGVWDVGGPGVISLGGFLGFKGFSNTYHYNSTTYKQKWNYTIIGIRSAYHYTGLDNDKVDLYGGVMLSYDILHYSDNYTGSLSGDWGSSGVGFTIYAGARYYFSPNFAGFAELGYGVSFLSLGVDYKF